MKLGFAAMRLSGGLGSLATSDLSCPIPVVVSAVSSAISLILLGVAPDWHRHQRISIGSSPHCRSLIYAFYPFAHLGRLFSLFFF